MGELPCCSLFEKQRQHLIVEVAPSVFFIGLGETERQNTPQARRRQVRGLPFCWIVFWTLEPTA